MNKVDRTGWRTMNDFNGAVKLIREGKAMRYIQCYGKDGDRRAYCKIKEVKRENIFKE